MEKFSAPIVVAVSAYLFFTHDAGFRFETAKPEKRAAFVERQAQRAVTEAKLVALSGADSIFISSDQLNARIKVDAEATPGQETRRIHAFAAACEGYDASYLGEHGIALRLEFFRDSGAISGTITLTERACAPYVKTKQS
jgi:photosystem II stability/assembly factor-like uncharacterized protein